MKALIQKDLRENLKVALIGLLIFSLLLLQAYQQSIMALTNLLADRGAELNAVQPLLSPTLLMEAAYFCAIFGAMLGWLQTRNEAHRDLWAFLIHRPVTRTKIFQGKTIAGLCLYLLGAGLPLTILVMVVRWPGHIAAPFAWAMVLPLFSILLTGVAYYFAGVLTGLRQARWYASRGFGIVLAIATSFGVFGFPEFWMCLVSTALAVVILATAAWGASQTGGFYRGQPFAGKLALLVAMAAGGGVTLFMGVMFLFGFILSPFSGPGYESNYHQMTKGGSIYKATSRNGQLVEMVDLEGRPLLEPATGQKMEPKAFQQHVAYNLSLFASPQYLDYRDAFHNEARFFILLRWDSTDKTIWYFDRDGKLISYDGRTRRLTGTLAPQNNDSSSTSKSFLSPRDYEGFFFNGDRTLLATAQSVYQVDFKARTAKPILTVPKDDIIRQSAGLYPYVDGKPTNYFFLMTHQTIRLFDSEIRPVFTLPHQSGNLDYPRIDVSILQPTNGSTTNFAVWFYPDDAMNEKRGWTMPIHVLWLRPDGNVARSADLPVLRPSDNDSWEDKLGTALLPPPAHLLFDKAIYTPWNALGFGLAFISAIIGWLLARRYSFSTHAQAGWTLIILLLGAPGLLALLCVQEWPAREPCPNCKKFRAVDRETCEHCSAPFSPPPKNGTEIFEPLGGFKINCE